MNDLNEPKVLGELSPDKESCEIMEQLVPPACR
jgi:hypothetical protein